MLYNQHWGLDEDEEFEDGADELLSLMGCVLYSAGGYSSTGGNVESLAGVPGTITEDFHFGYLFGKEPDKYVDELLAVNGPDWDSVELRGLPSAGILVSQDGKTRAVCHAGPDGTYRTICSSVVFSAIRGSPEEKQKLAAAYVGFLSR